MSGNDARGFELAVWNAFTDDVVRGIVDGTIVPEVLSSTHVKLLCKAGEVDLLYAKDARSTLTVGSFKCILPTFVEYPICRAAANYAGLLPAARLLLQGLGADADHLNAVPGMPHESDSL